MYIPLFGGFVRLCVFAPAAFWILAVSEGILPFLCMASAALAHEAGHLSAIKLTGCRVTRVTVYPFGGLIECTAAKDARGEAFVAAGGIAANAVCAFASGIVFCVFRNAYLLLFVFSSLFFALTNLLPLRTSDGGRLLYLFCETRRDAEYAQKICSRANAAAKILALSLAALMLWLSGFNNGLCVVLLIAAMPK